MYVIERRYGDIIEFVLGEGTPGEHRVRIHVGHVGSSQVRLAVEANQAVRIRRIDLPPEAPAEAPAVVG